MMDDVEIDGLTIRTSRPETLLDLLVTAVGTLAGYMQIARVTAERREVGVGRLDAGEEISPRRWFLGLVRPLLEPGKPSKFRLKTYSATQDKHADLTLTVTSPDRSAPERVPDPAGVPPPAQVPSRLVADSGGRPPGEASDGAPGDPPERCAHEASKAEDRQERAVDLRVRSLEAARQRTEDRLERALRDNDRLRDSKEQMRDARDRIAESRDNLRDLVVERTGERDEARQALGLVMAEVRRLRSERDRARDSETRALEQREAERARRRKAEEEREDADRTASEFVEAEAEIWNDNSLKGRALRFLASPADEDDED